MRIKRQTPIVMVKMNVTANALILKIKPDGLVLHLKIVIINLIRQLIPSDAAHKYDITLSDIVTPPDIVSASLTILSISRIKKSGKKYLNELSAVKLSVRKGDNTVIINMRKGKKDIRR